MNNLLFGTSFGALLTRNSSTSILKSSGTRTQAPTSKVLRWHDLEAGRAETAEGLEQSSIQSVFGTEDGERDLLNADELWQDEEEDLFL